MGYSPSGSSVLAIFHARILEWVSMSFSRGSSRLRGQTHVSCVSCTGRWIFFTTASPGKSSEYALFLLILFLGKGLTPGAMLSCWRGRSHCFWVPVIFLDFPSTSALWQEDYVRIPWLPSLGEGLLWISTGRRLFPDKSEFPDSPV